MRRISWQLRVGAWLAWPLFWLAGWAVAAPAPLLDHVTLQFKWKNQFQFAGYYAALAQGYYADAGLDVRFLEGSPDHDPTGVVLSGQADFGVGNSDLLLYRFQGKPVVVLAAIFQHSPLVLLARAASGATDLQALHDKRIMWIPSESAELRAYFKYEGVDPSTLNVRPHTFNIEDFISGNVDAMSAYSTDEPYLLKQRGVDFFSFMPRAGGIDFYGDCLFTTEQEIKDHPDRVRAFRAASLKGWDYALAHQEEIVDLILRKYNTQGKSRDQLLFEAQQTALLMHPELIEVGHMNPGRWRHMADTYAEFGMIAPDFPLEGLLYDPDPPVNYRWLYWTLAIVSIVAVGALGWALPLLRLNQRLRHVVARQRHLQAELIHAKEVAEAADLAKSRYLAVMSHEVRTPLTGIIGLAEHLQNASLTAEQTEMLALMEKSGEHMLNLIDDILEFSKIEAGRLELNIGSMDLAPLLEELRLLFSASLRDKHLDLKINSAPGTPGVITTDIPRLRRILHNLLSNAIKFTDKGGVTLEVAAAPEPSAAGVAGRHWRWRFVVRDTGIGLSPEQATVLFNPYAQAHAGIAVRFGGTGLGLAISHQLARLLGGSLDLSASAPGQGSTFTLEIVTTDPA